MTKLPKAQRILGPYREPKNPGSFPGRWYWSVAEPGKGARRAPGAYKFTDAAEEAVQRRNAEDKVRTLQGIMEVTAGITVDEGAEAFARQLLLEGRPPEPPVGAKRPKKIVRVKSNTARAYLSHLRAFFPKRARMTKGGDIVPDWPEGVPLVHASTCTGTGNKADQGCAPACQFRLDALGGSVIEPRALPAQAIDPVYARKLVRHLLLAPASRPRYPGTPLSGPLADDSVGKVFVCVHRMFEFMRWKKWYSGPNPFDGLHPPGLKFNPGGKGKRHLNYEDMPVLEAKAFAVAESHRRDWDWRQGAAVLCVYHLKMRREQLIHRRAHDIDMDGFLFHKDGFAGAETHAKNVGSERQANVRDPRFAAVLRRLKAEAQGPSGLLFPDDGHREGMIWFSEEEQRRIVAEWAAAAPVIKAGRPRTSTPEAEAIRTRYGLGHARLRGWRLKWEGNTAPAAPEVPHYAAWVTTSLRWVLRLAGLPDTMGAHGLRGGAGSFDLIEGVSTFKQVSEDGLNHSDPRTSRSAYISRVAEDLNHQGKIEALRRRRGNLALVEDPDDENR